HSRHVTVYDVTAPETDGAGALSELVRLLDFHKNRQGDHVLLPIDDASIWLCDLVPPSSGWILAGPRGDLTALALSKRKQVEMANAAGFNVPTTSVVSNAEELSASVVAFPVILRPANAVWFSDNRLQKGRNWICADEGELKLALSAWKSSCTLLVQPFLEGTG